MAGGALLPGWLLWSLPAMFLLHDAEKVLFLPPWLRRNRELLARRFPQLAHRMLPHFDGISPLRFAAMAAEELVLLVAVTACAALAGCYYPWLALFLAFGMHLLIHLGQWAVVGRYVPVITTSLPCLACCGWGLCIMINSRAFSLREFVLCGMAGCVAAAVNLWLVHRLAVPPVSGREPR